MDRDKAEQAMKLLQVSGDSACRALELLQGELEPEAFKKLRRAVGALNAIVALDLMPPIITVYPDLDLDGLRSRWKETES